MAEERTAGRERGDGAPMDEHTKSTVRALLGRYPRGYAAEMAGFTVTQTAAGLALVDARGEYEEIRQKAHT